jgi:type II secretory pathway pseudopilin PulG
MKNIKNKWFSLVELIIAIFILGIAILSTVILKTQILDQQDRLLSTYKITYFSNYINKIIETKTPTHWSVWDKSYITISWENINYSSDIANKTWSIDFIKNNDLFNSEHEIEYINNINIEGQDFYVFKISLKINSEEKIYYLTV